jgi:hypothetical protein
MSNPKNDCPKRDKITQLANSAKGHIELALANPSSPDLTAELNLAVGNLNAIAQDNHKAQ